LPTSTGESPYYLEIEKGYNKYMEEYHSTPSSQTLLHMAAGLLPMAAGLLPMAAAPLSLFFSSLHVLTHSHFSLSKHASFIGNSWQLSPAIARGQ
jgi:hypothetical protein